MSEFSDRPFVAGSLTGLRAFHVDRLGRLRGPVYDQVFKPGTNEAECRELADTYYTSMFRSLNQTMWSLGPPVSQPSKPKRFLGGGITGADPVFDEPRLATETVTSVEDPPKVEHVVGGLKCKCGFYAYFDGGNDYKEPNRVSALIEGFGLCTVGDRGFRASKARLLAIVVPGKRFPEDRFGLVERNYPDVPLFTSKRDAIAAHPLSADMAPTPETHADFWERDAK